MAGRGERRSSDGSPVRPGAAAQGSGQERGGGREKSSRRMKSVVS
jgi:hypothetical protein